MATIANPSPTKMVLKLLVSAGPPAVYKTKTFGDVRVAATDENIRLTAMEMAALIDLPIESILRIDTNTLVEA